MGRYRSIQSIMLAEALKGITDTQWKRRFKRALKKTIRKKIESIMWTVLTISVFILPFWMVLDWLLRGY